MRLIDADELKKALIDFMDAFIDSDGDMMYSDHLLIDADYIALCDYIDKQPTVQPKRGKWIPVDSFTAFGGDEATWMTHGNPTAFHYCSVCKGQAYAGEDGESLLTDFCPNCGANMRGD